MDYDPIIWYQRPSIHLGEVFPAAAQDCLSAIIAVQQSFIDYNNNFTAAIQRCQSRLQESRIQLGQIQKSMTKLRTATTLASNGPRYAPIDPTLPSPWIGLIDGSTGSLYYWNTESNHTQYERPSPPTLNASAYPIHPQPYTADEQHIINHTHPYPNPLQHTYNPPISYPHHEAAHQPTLVDSQSMVTTTYSEFPSIQPPYEEHHSIPTFQSPSTAPLPTFGSTPSLYNPKTHLVETISSPSPLPCADFPEPQELPHLNIAASVLIAGPESFHQPLYVAVAEELSLAGESAASDHNLEKKFVSIEGTNTFTNDARENGITAVDGKSLESEHKLDEVDHLSVHAHDTARHEELPSVWTALSSRASEGEEYVRLIDISSIFVPTSMVRAVTEKANYDSLLYEGEIFIGDGFCSDFALSYPTHSRASDTTNARLEVNIVATGVGSNLATRFATLNPETVQTLGSSYDIFSDKDNPCSDSTMRHQLTVQNAFRKPELGLVYHICRFGNFDIARRSFYDVSTACFDPLLNASDFLTGDFGERNMSILGKYQNMQVNSVMVFENIWHVELATAGNSMELVLLVRDGVQLGKEMAICPVDTQSEAELWRQLVQCFEIGHRETKSHHSNVRTSGILIAQASLSVNGYVNCCPIQKQREMNIATMLTSSIMLPFTLIDVINMPVIVLGCFLGCNNGGYYLFQYQANDFSSVETWVHDGNMPLVLRDFWILDDDYMLGVLRKWVLVPHSHKLLLDAEHLSQVPVLDYRVKTTLWSPNLVAMPMILLVSMLNSSKHTSRTISFEQYMWCQFAISVLMTPQDVAYLSVRPHAIFSITSKSEVSSLRYYSNSLLARDYCVVFMTTTHWVCPYVEHVHKDTLFLVISSSKFSTPFHALVRLLHPLSIMESIHMVRPTLPNILQEEAYYNMGMVVLLFMYELVSLQCKIQGIVFRHDEVYYGHPLDIPEITVLLFIACDSVAMNFGALVLVSQISFAVSNEASLVILFSQIMHSHTVVCFISIPMRYAPPSNSFGAPKVEKDCLIDIFSCALKVNIIFQEDTHVRKAKTTGIFPNSIEVEVSARGEKFFFASILVYGLMNDGWDEHFVEVRLLGNNLNSALSYSRYYSGSVILMTVIATQFVMHIFHSWLLCTYDEKYTYKPALTATLSVVTILSGDNCIKTVDVGGDLGKHIERHTDALAHRSEVLIAYNVEIIVDLESHHIGSMVESCSAALIIGSILVGMLFSLVVSSLNILVRLLPTFVGLEPVVLPGYWKWFTGHLAAGATGVSTPYFVYYLADTQTPRASDSKARQIGGERHFNNNIIYSTPGSKLQQKVEDVIVFMTEFDGRICALLVTILLLGISCSYLGQLATFADAVVEKPHLSRQFISHTWHVGQTKPPIATFAAASLECCFNLVALRNGVGQVTATYEPVIVLEHAVKLFEMALKPSMDVSNQFSSLRTSLLSRGEDLLGPSPDPKPITCH